MIRIAGEQCSPLRQAGRRYQRTLSEDSVRIEKNDKKGNSILFLGQKVVDNQHPAAYNKYEVTKPAKIVLIEVMKPAKNHVNRGYEAYQNRFNGYIGLDVAIIHRRKRMQNWVIVDEEYLQFLRATEERIPFSNYGTNKYKPFFGVLFEIGDLAYVTQISHAQPRHIRMRNAPDFIKVFIPDRNPINPDRLVAVINLNYMFPIHKSLIENLEYRDIEKHRTFRSLQEKSQYIDLLTREMAQIKTLGVDAKAKSLYERKKRFPNDAVSRRCIDFSALEPLAEEYVNTQATGKHKSTERGQENGALLSP